MIPFPLDEVWHLVKLKSIPKFWSIIASAEDVNVEEEVHAAKWKFKDGTTEVVKLEEHSCASLSFLFQVCAKVEVTI